MSDYTFKSFIVDCADNYGDSEYIGINSIDFYYDGNKITLSPTDFTCYSTSYYQSVNLPKTIFDTSLSKTGDDDNLEWFSSRGAPNKQRIICVVNNAVTFDTIVINNFHDSGYDTDIGIKNVKIYISSDSITNTTYDTSINNSVKIFDGIFDEHISSDVEDPETLTLIVLTQLSGTVKTPSGTIIESATVKALDSNDVIQGTGTTNSSGEFTIDNIPAGTYSIRAEKDTYKSDISNGVVAVGME